ncbi:MAG: hypothetical protein EWV55_11750 [Microcystis viridis Mv_BB_P_19951000_S69]|uniref:Uncharacterized protein n=1 Tax=Microcystis viridis Mv_BB_P_19951000_S68D TaxID=2486270 RepID=A0A552HAS5_MICVR|nr:MAG: hypothetical protein EWV77_20425 [Microcystis viridis Mv_BB_P_19951000_S68D]TRU74011.1 MAG: hypothetical protein EWV47_11760 [Microcystis viridis Mv_BB_P_19951000_S68]TRU74071.1 MAG: hypothetical protein EWV55_11750 [Microcystis viridis Mv_BB_P_19951000_S69]TRU87542.1 MAG: hypothetical protein EWV46_07865 [Microcystis viridis Mv_BB_P_19951000_S69D]
MYQAFETDVMDDLFYDQVEGPAQRGNHYNSYDAGDEFGEYDLAEADDDAFIGGLIRSGQGFDEMEDWGEQGYDSGFDALEDALADALAEDDTDEFFRRLGRIARSVGRRVGQVARGVGRGIGSVARVVAPIARMIPLPQAQLIGRIANVAGRLLADEADEFEALEDLFDLAETEDAIDAAAPFVSAVALRTAMPNISRLPRQTRRQLVSSVSQATRTLAHRQGPAAARAVPRIVRGVSRTVAQRGLPARSVAPAVRRATARVAQSPSTVRRLARPLTTGSRHGSRSMSGGRPCPTCGRSHSYRLRGPVTIQIQGS